MAWIESHQEIRDHPKTKRLMRLLGVPKAQAIGHLHLLWWWALSFAQDGNLSGFSAIDVADGAEWEGDPEEFYAALVGSGWIDQPADTSESAGTIHDWDEYGGNYIKRREQARVRQQRYREQQARDLSAHNGEVTRDTRDSHALTGQDQTRQDQSREETEESPAPPAPVRVKYSAAFEVFWAEWQSGFTKGHGAKKDAFDVWKRLGLDRAGANEMRNEVMAGLLRWQACWDWQKEGGRFIPHARNWLKSRGWEDEPPNTWAAHASPEVNGMRPKARGDDPHRWFAAADRIAAQEGRHS